VDLSLLYLVAMSTNPRRDFFECATLVCTTTNYQSFIQH
jgi:hypothetical protein